VTRDKALAADLGSGGDLHDPGGHMILRVWVWRGGLFGDADSSSELGEAVVPLSQQYDGRRCVWPVVRDDGTVNGKDVARIAAKFELHYQLPPVSNLHTSSVEQKGVTLTWDKLDGATAFALGLSREGGEWQSLTDRTQDATPAYAVMNLVGNTRYRFAIAGLNKAGVGEWTVTDVCTAAVDPSPPGTPLVRVSGQVVLLRWPPSANLGGATARAYHVFARVLGSSDWEQVMTDVMMDNVGFCSAEVCLAPGEYAFKVHVETDVGVSAPSPESEAVLVSSTVPSPPGAPRAIWRGDDRALVLDWATPESDGGSPLTGYLLHVMRLDRDEPDTHWTVEVEVLSSPAPYFSYYLYDLEQGVYALQLQALNAMGASSLSAPSGEVVVPESRSHLERTSLIPTFAER
jgi:hypothetical protein